MMATKVAWRDGPLHASRMKSRGSSAIVPEVLFGAGIGEPLVQRIRRHALACHMSVASRREWDWYRDRGVRGSALNFWREATKLIVIDSTAGVVYMMRCLNVRLSSAVY